jgi:hypothetical protein
MCGLARRPTAGQEYEGHAPPERIVCMRRPSRDHAVITFIQARITECQRDRHEALA